MLLHWRSFLEITSTDAMAHLIYVWCSAARNNAATPRSPFSQPDLQTSPAKGPSDRLRLPVLESLEDHELSGTSAEAH